MSKDNVSPLVVITKTQSGYLKSSINISLSTSLNEFEERLISNILPTAIESLKGEYGEVTIARHDEYKSDEDESAIIIGKHRESVCSPVNYTMTPFFEELPPDWLEERNTNNE